MCNLIAYMPSCSTRDAVRERTLRSLSAAGWQGALSIEFDDPGLSAPLERHTALVRRILRRAARAEHDIFLFLEDDLDFNRYFLENLATWTPLRQFTRGGHFYASLYNPGVQLRKSYPALACGEACSESAFGSQALLISQATARYLVTCWGVESSPHADLRLARLAARVCPLLYHLPSLVQHVGKESTWGGPFHCAADFDQNWKATTADLESVGGTL